MMREKAKRAAAEMLEVGVDDLEMRDGAVRVKGVPEMREDAGADRQALAGTPGFALPNGIRRACRRRPIS